MAELTRQHGQEDNQAQPQQQPQEQEDKASFYDGLLSEAQGLLQGERDAIANLSNISALVSEKLNARGARTNWVGFYLSRPLNYSKSSSVSASVNPSSSVDANNAELIVGPFQGLPACVHIRYGRGVCGTAASQGQTLVVPDVHLFPGHIACDSRSNSEIVIPLKARDGAVIGVFDLDSLDVGTFDEADEQGLSTLAQILVDGCDWGTAGPIQPVRPAGA